MKIFTETDRLILREIVLRDVEGIYELDADPEVHQFLGNKPLKNKEQAIEVIQFIRKQYADYGIGRWAVIDKNTHAFMGWAGLKWITEETNKHINYLDVGYRFIKRYWGKGYATEAATASVKYAFENLDAKELFAIAAGQNIVSDKVLLKIGFRFIETFDYENTPHNWYRLSKSSFYQSA